MRDLIFPIRHDSTMGLQAQLRRHLVEAIIDGRLSTEESLPSCRRLARALGVSRNTVVLAYQALTDEGLLLSRERVGYFVNAEMVVDKGDTAWSAAEQIPAAEEPEKWWQRFKIRPSEQLQLIKPKNWRSYPYPFIYGQPDPSLFPVAAWRLCSRESLSVQAIRNWSEDSFADDDPRLLEEIRTRVLPRRGIRAAPSEILVTLGAQNALFLVSQLLIDRTTTVGFEDPGYPDARNIFALSGGRIRPLPVDDQGVLVNSRLHDCEYVYVTPSHQSPTTVTLPLERRLKLLEMAESQNFMVIEDDYEAETNYVSAPITALKSIDRDHRVIYIGSFSKYLAPGLRIGYLVGPSDLIREARLLRRLMVRHPPANVQHTVALFISGGYYDALLSRLQRGYRDRWRELGNALKRHLAFCEISTSRGGTSYWVRAPDAVDTDVLATRALSRGLVVEPGSAHFHSAKPPRSFLRLGFSSIELQKIEPGIKILAQLIEESL